MTRRRDKHILSVACPCGSTRELLQLPMVLRLKTLLFWSFAISVMTLMVTLNIYLLNNNGNIGSSSAGNVPGGLSWSLGESYGTTGRSYQITAEPLVDLLRHTNVSLSRKEIEALPTWKEVLARFGAKPRILGLETCAAYRREVPRKNKRAIAPAGAFNSGTNLLYSLLANNCRVSAKNPNTLSKTGVDWQVNWGKHQSPRFRFNNTVRDWKNNSAYLPIVVVRDPWTWLQSMCRQNYAAIWYHVPGPEGHCPNLIPSDVEQKWFSKSRSDVARYFRYDKPKVQNVLLKANFTLDMKTVPVNVRYKNEVARHQSLAHFWKEWYQEYYDAKFPRLMIRLEDLVFHPYDTLKPICDCVHGELARKDNFTLEGESIKEGNDRAHSRTQKTDLISAFSLHLRSNRTHGMTLEDKEFAQNVLNDSVVRQYFEYQPPDLGT